jgi:diguanylate cyclase (GGDEF)-like protein/PAS domain S-box-containing protein
MKSPFQVESPAEELRRLFSDNALDAFVAADACGNVLEWNSNAQEIFGWSREEVLGRSLSETVVPGNVIDVHFAHLSSSAGGVPAAGQRLHVLARRRDGKEIPVELTLTPIVTAEQTVMFATVRDISQRQALEQEILQQANLTTSILNSMPDAVIVADLSGHLVMVNPAAETMLGVKSVSQDRHQGYTAYQLYEGVNQIPFPPEQRPIWRALRGEHVDNMVAWVHAPQLEKGAWVSVNARPMHDSSGNLAGAVVVFRDITELRAKQEQIELQASRLQEQASLLDLSHDAILVRDSQQSITYWNRSAQRMYGYSQSQALGRIATELLRTRFPEPLEAILARVHQNGYWEGEVVQTTAGGREIIVFTQWALDMQEGQPYRYLETNADITQRVQTERALRQSQQDFRLLVEASTDYAIMMINVQGIIQSWNSGAERVLGLSAEQAIGRPVADLFTAEDRGSGQPWRELDEARSHGRAEDARWHMRSDGTRFWASGVVTPLRNEDGSLRGFVKIMRDQTTQRLAEEQTQFLASHDALTGLPNRVSFSNELHQSLALSLRNNIPLAVLLLDLDRFKFVNDTFGHHTGDLLLKEVALRLMSSIRETDFVARLGGDEFVVIQSDTSQPQAAQTMARKLVQELGRPYVLDSQEVLSGTSIGIALFPQDAKNSVELLKRADLALYRAKDAGRHNFQFYTAELVSAQNWRRDREAALRSALKNHQFELYYQPQVNLQSWRMASVEALLRWNASDMEMVLPDDFLHIVEETGLIVEIGEWALREACHQVRRWQAQGLSELRLSVNCSARQFSDPRFVTLVPSILRDAGLAPSSLELEVPESMLTAHPEIKEQLAELRMLGIRLTIDNFGTGNTSFKDFKDFGIDVLKIDKAFVQHLPYRREDSAIASAIITLAHDLGINVVAGGVETAEQLAYLKARDCTGAQGFIFSPPVSARRFEELLLKHSWSRMNRGAWTLDGTILRDLH